MSKWTHSLCATCYAVLEPGRIPSRMIDVAVREICCRCGTPHTSGIYYRANPGKLKCRGIHAD